MPLRVTMVQLDVLEFLRLNKFEKLLYKIKLWFCSIPNAILNFFKKIWAALVRFGLFIANQCVDIGRTFKNGNWAVKLSFLIMGVGNFAYGQILRGSLFLLFEIVFILYMVFVGAHWLSMFDNLGDKSLQTIWVEETDPWGDVTLVEKTIAGDDSFKILLYGLLSILFILAFIYTWRLQIKQCRICMEITASGKKVKSGKDDLKSILDDQFHKTLLALPVTGIALFTVLPIIFMILVGFTNFDAKHDGYSNLFTWVGMENFNEMLNFGDSGMGLAFGEVLAWTLIWAVFATFTNYFLGMFVAIMINKKGIKIKKFWRTVLVLTIAIPQFVSLIYVRHMFDYNGLINNIIVALGGTRFKFWDHTTWARALVIVINIWIGIPYIMLMATGILMNIPQDLYESAKIDGANVWQQYTRITLPYMMFVLGPHLLTSFVGNLNNFNVIYLLSAGNPPKMNSNGSGVVIAGGATVGDTDILITWLFNMALGSETNYKMASVVGVCIFAVVAVLSLIVYNVMPSTRNEEDFR